MNEIVENVARTGILVLVGVALFVAYRRWGNYQATRGSLEFDLPRRRFRPNELIEGAITVQADKKDLGPGRLVVSLVCEERWEERRNNDDGPDHWDDKKKVLHRHDVDVATELSLHAGNSQAFNFTLPIPATDIDNRPGSGIGRFFKGLGRRNERQVWLIEGRYDVRGPDLTTVQFIAIDFAPPPPPPPSPGGGPMAPPPTSVPPPPPPPN